MEPTPKNIRKVIEEALYENFQRSAVVDLEIDEDDNYVIHIDAASLDEEIDDELDDDLDSDDD